MIRIYVVFNSLDKCEMAAVTCIWEPVNSGRKNHVTSSLLYKPNNDHRALYLIKYH